jgi:hypothetical protein
MTDCTPDDQAALERGECPDCGQTGQFLAGPRGGDALNIMCANCGAKFNVLSFDGRTWTAKLLSAQRIDNAPRS